MAASRRAVIWVDDSLAVEIDEPTRLDPAAKTNAESIVRLCYLAPEQTGVLNRPANQATDLYAFGLLLFRMITGRDALAADDLNDLLIRQTTWTAVSLRAEGYAIPRSLDEMIMRLIRRDPQDRYQKSVAALEDLDAILEYLESGQIVDSHAIGTSDVRERFAESSLVGARDGPRPLFGGSERMRVSILTHGSYKGSQAKENRDARRVFTTCCESSSSLLEGYRQTNRQLQTA